MNTLKLTAFALASIIAVAHASSERDLGSVKDKIKAEVKYKANSEQDQKDDIKRKKDDIKRKEEQLKREKDQLQREKDEQNATPEQKDDIKRKEVDIKRKEEQLKRERDELNNKPQPDEQGTL